METSDLDTDNGAPSSVKSEIQMKRSDSPTASCVSMKSDVSKDIPPELKDVDSSSVHSQIQIKRSDSPSCVSMKSDESMDPPSEFKDVDSSFVHSDLREAEAVTEKNIVTDTGHNPETAVNELKGYFKISLLKKFEWLNGVMINQGNPILLNEIYTELYITEGDSGDINNEHEVRQMEAASRRKTTEETPIKCNDIFKPLSEE
ncbi:hypothetical protein PGIGA_G00177670, partial [Pangasianodon gigas]|nr:hypothetical protein [Pangasianodon gigas]